MKLVISVTTVRPEPKRENKIGLLNPPFARWGERGWGRVGATPANARAAPGRPKQAQPPRGAESDTQCANVWVASFTQKEMLNRVTRPLPRSRIPRMQLGHGPMQHLLRQPLRQGFQHRIHRLTLGNQPTRAG